MSKITKQFAAKLFLSMWKVTGYRVRKIARFSENDNLKSIAIISNTALGDFLFNTPSIRAIKERWPNAKITLVILKRNHPLVEGSNIFDEVLYWGGKVSGMLSLIKSLRKNQVEATFILHSRTPYDILTASLAGSRYIFKDVYYTDYQGRKDFILKTCLSSFYDNRKKGNIHFIRQKTEILESVGIMVKSESMFIPAPYKPQRYDKTVIGIHAGASSTERCWPESAFSLLISKLINEYSDLVIELIGAPGEKALNQRIIEGMESQSDRVINVAGSTNLIQLAEKISGFTTLIVGDTGPLHLAIAVKTPTVALFPNQSTIDGGAPLQDKGIHQVLHPDDEKNGLRGINWTHVYDAVARNLS
ncbi:glycosyltransferase family 9 protein [Pantoea ananatis]|uniref:glycosyltransferase family 9 protein n=1 Tax=Pantoea ananas TaxID=553 RepID=UPI0009198F0C|nr:glycosyltransferase family 9 protein [Pantoea ananatis]MDJ0033003.1 glycosyltransferase family 9 protein [Pantoea ananatis]MDJ0046253.1 glycosyltransferase family 9 protein [Pantoea ananatis]SFX62824.1 ADP-heptose:LPS heptosyltransferase [Pantoea ananatis]